MSEIVNVELHNRAATLHEPTGPVVGFDNVGITSQKWEIRNIGVNRTTIQNVLTKTFARVNFEADGAPVIGSSPVQEPYVWRLILLPGGVYHIATEDQEFFWRLTGPEENAPIVLQRIPYEGKDAEWFLGIN